MTTVVSIRKKKGCPRAKYDVYIGRGTSFGNIFRIGVDGDRQQVIVKYKKYFYRRLTDPIFRNKVLELKGKVLGCYCHPLKCHCDVIAEYLDKE